MGHARTRYLHAPLIGGTRSQPKSPPGAHAILLLIRPAGIAPKPWLCRATSHSCRCRHARPNQENIWQFIGQSWLSNRIFKSFDDIVDHCCYAWNTLIDQDHVHRATRLGSSRSLNLRLGISWHCHMVWSGHALPDPLSPRHKSHRHRGCTPPNWVVNRL
jgi:hypothetical protein